MDLGAVQIAGFVITAVSAAVCAVYYPVRIVVMYLNGTLRPGMTAEQRYQVIRKMMMPAMVMMGLFVIGVFMIILPELLR